MRKLLPLCVMFFLSFGLSAQMLGEYQIIDWLDSAEHPEFCDDNYVTGPPNDSTWVNFSVGNLMTGYFSQSWRDTTGDELLLETSYNTDNYDVRLILSDNSFTSVVSVDVSDWENLGFAPWVHLFETCTEGVLQSDQWIYALDFTDFGVTSADTVIGIEVTFLDSPGAPDISGVYIVSGEQECNLEAEISNIICDDNGTGNPFDDTWTFEIVVVNDGDSSSWYSNNLEFEGEYDSLYIMGPFFIDDGIIVVDIIDLLDSTCTITIEVVPPLPCSEEECVDSTSFSISVDNNVICEGDTALLVASPGFQDYEWNDGTEDDSLEVTLQGQYIVTAIDTCGDLRADTVFVMVLENKEETIEFLIEDGESVEVNGEEYDEEGSYTQDLIGQNGCDSTLTINVFVNQVIVHYSLDDCLASAGETAIYDEFTADVSNQLSCGSVTATHASRAIPNFNRHSCTPGIDGTAAICISSLNNCGYLVGDSHNFTFDVVVSPNQGESIQVSGFSFYEKAPEMFDWINGNSGLNDYPTLFGIRVLKDGVQIFDETDLPTNLVWTFQEFNFANNDEFLVDEPVVFTFEMLPYCFIGNDADVQAWDLDEISITGHCAGNNFNNGPISGIVQANESGDLQPMTNVECMIMDDNEVVNVTTTNEDGLYLLENIDFENGYKLDFFKKDDYLNGVSTLDMILIKKHLLGYEQFDANWKYVAADVNNNGVISAVDMTEIRKTLLGLQDEFDNNTSWRFFTEESLQARPFELEQEFSPVSLLAPEGLDLDVRGIKVADLNNTVTVDLTENTESRSSLDIMLENSNGVLSFKAIKAMDLAGLQIALDLDDEFDALTLIAGKMNINSDHYSFDTDQLRISWDAETSVDVNEGDVLFMIDADLDLQQLSIAETLSAEAYTGTQLNIHELQLRVAGEQASSSINITNAQPNPFKESTTIGFSISEDSDVSINIMDLNGKQIFSNTAKFAKGQNEIVLNASSLNNISGVYVAELVIADEREMQKIVLVD